MAEADISPCPDIVGTSQNPSSQVVNLMRRFLLAAALLACAAVLTSTTTVRAQQGRAVDDDINGDGSGDLVIGVPREDVAGSTDAGKVNVLFGDGSRITKVGDVAVSRVGVQGGARADGLFGSAVELAHIDGDAFADMIVGSTGETVDGAANAGEFVVIRGSADGPDMASVQIFTQSDLHPGGAETGDFFGYNIASGDFDDDGYDDIAVSAPFEDDGDIVDSGSVTVVPGGPDGLVSEEARTFTQADLVGQGTGPGDFFGWSVVSDDFDGDGHADLAVGAPGEDRGAAADSGAVHVLYGSPDGLTTDGNQAFDQSGPIKNRPEIDDLFGFSLGSSDLNCDGVADLAVGVPNESLGPDDVIAGAVHVILGSSNGLRADGNVLLTQASRRIAGSLDFNQFGTSLAGGRFDRGRCGDLAIGAPTTGIGGTGATICAEDPGCAHQAGAVVVVYGSKSWPRPGGTGFFSQRGRVPGTPQEDDFFGRTVAALDVDGNGIDDLVVGVPFEDVRGKRDAGLVTVLRGTRRGIVGARSYAISQAGKVADRPERDDRFGASLTDSIS